MKKIKTILIGLGKIGFSYDLNKKQNYFTHSKVLKKINSFDFVCGIDTNKKKLSKFNKIYKIDTSNNLKSSILKHEPSFAVVSVNTERLFSILKSISKYDSIKNVLVEKPGCKNYHELKQIIKIYKNKNINLFINYNRSYDKNIRNYFKKLKTESNFKTIYFYNRGLLNNCSHFLNLVFLFLEVPKKIIILNKGKKFKNDLQPDLKLIFEKGEIFFISSNKNIIQNEFISLNDKYKLNSNEDFTTLKLYKLQNSKLISKYKSFSFDSDYKINRKTYQTNVYNEILKVKKNNLINNINQSSLKVLDFYKKLVNIYEKTL